MRIVYTRKTLDKYQTLYYNNKIYKNIEKKGISTNTGKLIKS